MTYDLSGKRIYVAGHRGMVGGAVVRRLAAEDCEVITAPRTELDLTQQGQVEAFIADTRPDAIVMAAAKVGGILANDSFPVDFLIENLAIETNLVRAAHAAGVGRFLFLGSSCIYPRMAPQPLVEDALLSGPLEPTNEWYAVAKIAGIKMMQAYRRQYGRDYISAIPSNLYGPHDNFDPASSHVLPALIRKAHEAKVADAPEITLWGTGAPMREFLYSEDCADALVFLLKAYSSDAPVNVGSGEDLTILELARTVARIVGFKGRIGHDLSKPDGTPRKLLSVDRLCELGWRPKVSLEDGIERTYRWFLENEAANR